MAKQIIDARIKQKTGTFEEWNNNPLILLDGEVALVRTATGALIQQRVGDGFKTFAELPDNIRYDQSAFIQVNAPSKVTGNYTVVGAGTYGGVTVGANKIAVLYWNGTDWVKNFEGELPIILVDGVIEQGNTNAVSGGEVFETVQPKKILKQISNGAMYYGYGIETDSTLITGATYTYSLAQVGNNKNITIKRPPVGNRFRVALFNGQLNASTTIEVVKVTDDLNVFSVNTGNYDNVLVYTSNNSGGNGRASAIVYEDILINNFGFVFNQKIQPVEYTKTDTFIDWQTSKISSWDSYGSIIIPLKGTSIINVTNISGDRFRGGYFKNMPVINSVCDEFVTFRTDSENKLTYYHEHEDGYLFMYLNSTGVIDENISVEAYSLELNEKLYKSSDSDEKRDSVNIFKGEYLNGYTLYTSPDAPDGQHEFRTSTLDRVSFIFEIESNREYFIKLFDATNVLKVATFTEYPENNMLANRSICNQQNVDGDNFTKFTAGIDDKYCVIVVSYNSTRPRMNVTRDVIINDYLEPKLIKSSAIETKSQDVFRFNQLVGDFTSYYKFDNAGTYVGSVVNALNTITLYGWYDDLMTTYPNIITKNLIGYGADSSNTEDISLPIYEYVISPRQTLMETWKGMNVEPYKAPKILLLNALHGDEKSTPVSTYLFIKDMLDNWKTQPTLRAIKSNFEIRIIPVANPGGLNDGTRRTRAGINLNRNFEWNWNSPQNKTGGLYEWGTDPLSGIETQSIHNWLDTHSDAFMYVDFHNFTREYDGRDRGVSMYLISQSVEQQKLFSSYSRVLSDEWSDRYYSDYSDLGNVNYGYISSETFSASVNDAYVLFGIKNSSLIEITLNKSGSTSVRYTNDVIETGTELIGNWILAVVNSYKN